MTTVLGWAGLAAGILGLGAVIGCATPGAENSADSTGAVSARHDSGPLPTQEANIALLKPYNYVFDQVGPGANCVGWAGDPQVQVQAGAITVSSNYITSLSSLENQLGIDAAIGAKLDPVAGGPGGSGEITAKYTSSTSHSDSTYSYLLTVEGHYDVAARAAVNMVQQPAGPDAFLHACGDSYVRALRYSASVQLLMTVTASTKSTADSVAAQLTASASQTTGVQASGTFKGGVTTSSKADQSSFNVSFTLVATGIGDASTLSMPTTADASAFATATTSLQGYLKQLSTSIAKDSAADAATPDGHNPNRQAIPSLVTRGFYTDVPNFDAGNNPFGVLDARLQKALFFVNAIGALKTQLDDVYFDEIEGFLNADNQAKFNIASPDGSYAHALPNTAALRQVAMRQQQIFEPHDGSGALAGNVTSGVRALLYACRDSTHVIDNSGGIPYAACTAQAATELPAYQAALAALNDYATTSRILPLRYEDEGAHGIYRSCTTGRSPTQAEALALAPAAAADPKGCAWYDGAGGGCLTAGYFTGDPSASANPTDKSQFACSADVTGLFGTCALLCVPPDGNLFGTFAPLGSGYPTAPRAPTKTN
jgi:hypothetical protein